MPKANADIYEVQVVPEDADLGRDLDLRFPTIAEDIDCAITKVHKHLVEERGKFFQQLGKVRFIVHERKMIR